jgi:glycogen(starch) synthase
MDASKQKNIRLLMTADTIGGVWTYAIDLIKGLQAHGVEVHLATMGRTLSQAQRKQLAAIPNLRLHESTYKLEWMDAPWQEVDAAGDWLLELEEELQPDLIHLNNFCHGDQPWQTPVLIVGHSCINSWWQAVKGEDAPRKYHEYTERVKGGLQSADLVIAPSRAFLAELQHFYGPLEPSLAIPNAREEKFFYPAKKEPLILSMGRLWDEAKNINACEYAAERVSWTMEVAGAATHPSGGKNADYQNLVPLGELTHEVVAAKLSKAAIYALPARYEPFGLSVLEAALSGCALVLGDIASLRENWQGAALFADPDSPEDLYDKIDFLIRNPRQRERMSGLALQKAREFSVSRQAALYLQHYKNILKKRETPEKPQSKTKPAAAVKL